MESCYKAPSKMHLKWTEMKLLANPLFFIAVTTEKVHFAQSLRTTQLLLPTALGKLFKSHKSLSKPNFPPTP